MGNSNLEILTSRMIGWCQNVIIIEMWKCLVANQNPWSTSCPWNTHTIFTLYILFNFSNGSPKLFFKQYKVLRKSLNDHIWYYWIPKMGDGAMNHVPYSKMFKVLLTFYWIDFLICKLTLNVLIFAHLHRVVTNVTSPLHNCLVFLRHIPLITIYGYDILRFFVFFCSFIDRSIRPLFPKGYFYETQVSPVEFQ